MEEAIQTQADQCASVSGGENRVTDDPCAICEGKRREKERERERGSQEKLQQKERPS